MSGADFDELVRAVWIRNRAGVRERLDVLAATAADLRSGSSSVDLGPAQVAAHKLAGSLGTFGFPWASEVAMGVHRLLDHELDGAADRIQLGERLGGLVERLQEMLPLGG